MANYKLRFVDPDNSTQFLGEAVETAIMPQAGDPHTIAGKKYSVKSVTPSGEKAQEGEAQEMHVRIEELGGPVYPRIARQR